MVPPMMGRLVTLALVLSGTADGGIVGRLNALA